MLLSSCSKEGQEVNHDGAYNPRAMIYDFHAPGRHEQFTNAYIRTACENISEFITLILIRTHEYHVETQLRSAISQ